MGGGQLMVAQRSRAGSFGAVLVFVPRAVVGGHALLAGGSCNHGESVNAHAVISLSFVMLIPFSFQPPSVNSTGGESATEDRSDGASRKKVEPQLYWEIGVMTRTQCVIGGSAC